MDRPDPACAICSQPVRSGNLVLYLHGEFLHVACRRREGAPDLQPTRKPAARLDANRPLRATAGACPLCAHPADVIDWRPASDWIAVEGCPCAGFFVAGSLMAQRVRNLTARDRADLAARVRAFRAMGHEAWLTTTVRTGWLVVRTERPDRPMEPSTRPA